MSQKFGWPKSWQWTWRRNEQLGQKTLAGPIDWLAYHQQERQLAANTAANEGKEDIVEDDVLSILDNTYINE